VVYNEALVKRVMLLFSFDCLDCWYEELAIKIPPSIDKTLDDYVDGIIFVVVDSTGLKVYNRGEWIREIYGPKVWRKRGFIKMHVSFDIRKILSLRVTDERVKDHKMFKELIMSTGF